jgi:hypothetical protein
MYVLACIPIYGDRGRDLCCDPAGSQERAPELGVGCELAIKRAPYRIAKLVRPDADWDKEDRYSKGLRSQR